MAGFLDTLFGNADQTQALGLLGVGMMNGGFGQGAGLAMQHLAGAKDRQRKGLLGDLQIQEAQAKLEDSRRKREFLQTLPNPSFVAGQAALANGGGPTLANAANVRPVNPMHDMLFRGVQAGEVPLETYLKTMTPAERINKLDAKDFTPESVQRFNQTGNYADLVRLDKLHFADTGGRVTGLNPFTGQEVGGVDKTGNPFSDLILGNGQGGFRQNTPLVTAKRGIAAAGAPQVNVNTDKSYFGNVAEGLAKNDVAAIEAGRSATERVLTSQKVRDILTKNPITGTGAEARIALNKALATAGVIDGQNVADSEVLGTLLASQALDAIRSSGLGGGNGFSNADRDFLERARAGKIDMTPQALARIAELNERTARAAIKRGNSVIGKLRMTPQAGVLGQQLDPIEEPPPYLGPSVVRKPPSPASAPGKARFLGFE